MNETPAVLFVCTGNICRSPLAEGIFGAMIEHTSLAGIRVDSAGIHPMLGNCPEPFAIEIANNYGSDISQTEARAVTEKDFEQFTHILALDLSQLDYLRFMKPAAAKTEVELLMGYAELAMDLEVPDPFRGKRRKFEQAARLIEQGARGLVDELLRRYAA